MLKVSNLAVDGLQIERFTAAPGEAWALVGAIGSGIEQFSELLAGATTSVAGLERPADLGLCSFKRQQQVFEDELRKDDTDFLNRLDPGTPARAFLTDVDHHRDLIALFALDTVLDQGYRQLSSGQARKLCLLGEITRGATFLVLENPYDGLDQASCRELDRVLPPLLARGIGLVLLVNNQDDIPSWCTHLAGFEHGNLVAQGPRQATWPAIEALLRRQQPLFRVSVADLRTRNTGQRAGSATDRLVTLRQGFARYDDIQVFAGLDLEVHRGEHTLITGPNGCGKSTLLHLITGDHPLCYRNDLTLFGRKRGSGESIWELKQQMGILSPDLHRNHRVAGSALAIVLSGLFDSIGLYTKPTDAQRQLGQHWLERLGLAAKAQRPFRQMSHGEQRLLLLARALIKSPQLLLLDEPTYGLDQANRNALLDFLAEVAAENLATILYVSHRQDEYRPFFRQEVRFVSGRDQGAGTDGVAAIVARRTTAAEG